MKEAVASIPKPSSLFVLPYVSLQYLGIAPFLNLLFGLAEQQLLGFRWHMDRYDLFRVFKDFAIGHLIEHFPEIFPRHVLEPHANNKLNSAVKPDRLRYEGPGSFSLMALYLLRMKRFFIFWVKAKSELRFAKGVVKP
ncbi:MAG: hypothetical protein AAF672_03205 [Pseudomonadota bacterium]